MSDSDDLKGGAPDKEILEDKEIIEEEKQPVLKEKLISFQMTFRDSGCGISHENKDKLFMNFSKLKET